MKILNKSSFFLILLLLSLVAACSKRPAQTVTTLNLSGLSSSFSALLGYEIMIYGVNRDNNDSFGRKFNGSSLELSNGRWDFVVASWNGAAMEESSTFLCGKSTATLAGGDQSVSISLSPDNCALSDFGPSRTKNVDNQPLLTKISTYANPECFEKDGLAPCFRGTARSYQIILPEFDGSSLKTSGVSSSCVNHSNSELSAYSNIRMPLFTPTSSALKIPYRIIAYHEIDCVGSNEVFVLSNGFLTPMRNRAEINMTDEYGIDQVEVELRSNLCLRTGVDLVTGFTFSTTGSPGSKVHVICSATQFNQIESYLAADTLHRYEIFLLGKDIDFAGQQVTPIGEFSGKFVGLNHSMKNLLLETDSASYGLIKELTGSAFGHTLIRDLKIENANLKVNSHWVAGILVGRAHNNVLIENISIHNSVINLHNTTGSNIYKYGAIAGEVAHDGADEMLISKVHVNNIRVNIFDEKVNEFGGVFGRLNGQTSALFIRNINVNGVVIDTKDAMQGLENFGGFAGAAQQTFLKNIIVDGLSLQNNSNQKFLANYNMGGLIGITYGDVTLEDSSVTGVISQSGNPCVNCGNNIGGAIGSVMSGGDYYKNLVVDVQMDIPFNDETSGVGGAIGSIQADMEMYRVRSFGPVTGNYNIGGLVGIVGGDGAALNSNTAFSQSYARGNVYALVENAGGLFGRYNVSGAMSIVRDVFASGNVSAYTFARGLIGHWLSGKIEGAVSYGSVSADMISGVAGALIGKSETPVSEDNTLINVYASAPNLIGFERSIINLYNGAPDPIAHPSCFYNSVLTSHMDMDCQDVVASPAALDPMKWSASTWNSGAAPLYNYVVPLTMLGEKVLGSLSRPYLINSTAVWNAVGDDEFLMSRVFRLTADLNFSGVSFKPWASESNPFRGILQGNNRVISNIDYVADMGEMYVGLIRVIESFAFNESLPFGVYHTDLSSPLGHRTLTLAQNKFHAEDFSSRVGVLAGYVADGGMGQRPLLLEGIRVVGGEVSGNGTELGGVAGLAQLYSSNSRIHDLSSSVTLSQCQAGYAVSAGGVFGKLDVNTYDQVRMTSIQSNVNVDVNCDADITGGLIGSLYNYGAGNFKLRQVVFDGTIRAQVQAGGFVGYASGSTLSISSSISKGQIYSDGVAGGFVAFSSASHNGLQIDESLSLAVIEAIDEAGSGLMLGMITSDFYINKSYSFSPLSDLSAIGDISLGSAYCSFVYNTSLFPLGSQTCTDGEVENITFNQLIDQSYVQLDSGDPFFFDGITRPKMYYEVFPQFFYVD